MFEKIREKMTCFFKLLLSTSLCLTHTQQEKLNGQPNMQSPLFSGFSEDSQLFNDNNEGDRDVDAVADEKIKYYLSKKVEDAFTAHVYGCSSSLVGDQWVITAAHCLEFYNL